MLCPRASIGPGEGTVVCFYINEIQQTNGSVELLTVISKPACAPLFFLQTCYHIEITPKDPSLGADVIGNPF
jgi:hypothetical protein